jgi:hypothetical protein
MKAVLHIKHVHCQLQLQRTHVGLKPDTRFCCRVQVWTRFNGCVCFSVEVAEPFLASLEVYTAVNCGLT